MKTTIHNLLLVTMLALLSLASCKNDGFYYQDQARARIEGPEDWAMGADSLEFSFSAYPSEITDMAMTMTLYVMGNAADTDRKAVINVVAERTTAEAAHYTLPNEVIVPAGKLSADFDIVLHRTTDLQTKNARLYITIAPSADFLPGVVEQNHFLIKWNDQLSKPKNWDSELKEFFGDYSLTKYRFIIEVTGISKFSTADMTWSLLNNYRIRLNNALNEYNALNPGRPLTDEYGKLVTF